MGLLGYLPEHLALEGEKILTHKYCCGLTAGASPRELIDVKTCLL